MLYSRHYMLVKIECCNRINVDALKYFCGRLSALWLFLTFFRAHIGAFDYILCAWRIL